MCDAPKARLLHVLRKRSDHTIATNAKVSKVSPLSQIFIRKLYRVKNSKFYCPKNYLLYGMYITFINWLFV